MQRRPSLLAHYPRATVASTLIIPIVLVVVAVIHHPARVSEMEGIAVASSPVTLGQKASGEGRRALALSSLRTGTEEPPDTRCATRCLARVPTDAPVPLVWRHNDVAYAIVDSRSLTDLRAAGMEVTIVRAGDDTLTLYGMFDVNTQNAGGIVAVGTVLDGINDIRLVAVQKVPLSVRALYATGIHVEKVTPLCLHSEGIAPFSLSDTLSEFVRIGTSDRLPLGDRQYDGPGTVQAAAYLYCRFEALGFSVRYDDFADDGGRQQLNVVAAAPNQPIGANSLLVTGHYDTRSPVGTSAPGADDNASGIAGMLDLASRDAQSGFAYPFGFVAFAAEEPGLLGSAAYADELARNGIYPKAAVNLDAIGIPNNGAFFVNGNAASRSLYLQLVAASTNDETLLWMTNPNFLSDDEELRRHGDVAVMLTTHPYGTEPLHHTDRDRIENLDLGQIATITDLVWQWATQQPHP